MSHSAKFPPKTQAQRIARGLFAGIIGIFLVAAAATHAHAYTSQQAVAVAKIAAATEGVPLTSIGKLPPEVALIRIALDTSFADAITAAALAGCKPDTFGMKLGPRKMITLTTKLVAGFSGSGIALERLPITQAFFTTALTVVVAADDPCLSKKLNIKYYFNENKD